MAESSRSELRGILKQFEIELGLFIRSGYSQEAKDVLVEEALNEICGLVGVIHPLRQAPLPDLGGSMFRSLIDPRDH